MTDARLMGLSRKQSELAGKRERETNFTGKYSYASAHGTKGRKAKDAARTDGGGVPYVMRAQSCSQAAPAVPAPDVLSVAGHAQQLLHAQRKQLEAVQTTQATERDAFEDKLRKQRDEHAHEVRTALFTCHIIQHAIHRPVV